MTDNIHQIVDIIRQGGVIAYPTEAVFGLGCDPSHLTAVQRILAIKQRSAAKGLILIAAQLQQLEPYIMPLTQEMQERIFPTWPGPVTWVVPTYPYISPLLRGEHNSIAVRVSAHPAVQVLCQTLGQPLVSTSANLAGQQPFRNAKALQAAMGQQLDAILDLPVGKRAQPSEIRDAITGALIRAG